jgi:hypothetical protein
MKMTRLQSDIGSSGYRQPYRAKIPRGFSQVLAPRWLGWSLSDYLYAVPGMTSTGFLSTWRSANVSDNTSTNPILLNGQMLRTIHANLVSDEALTATTSLGYNTMRFWIDYVKVKHTFKNQSNRDAKITLYNITPRKDVTYQYQSGVAPNLIITRAANPWEDWDLGYKDMSAQLPPGYQNWTQVPGTTPFKSGRFMQNWKVKAMTSFTLKEGKTHTHTTFLSPKYPLNVADTAIDPDLDTTSTVLNNAANVDWKKGVAHFIMYTVSGPLIHDNADGNITTGRSKVEYLVSGSARFRAIGKNRTIMNHFGGLDTNVGADEEDEMDEETHQMELRYREPASARVAGDPGTVPGM